MNNTLARTTGWPHRFRAAILVSLSALLPGLPAAGGRVGDLYDLSWHTIDGGGAMRTTGGVFELSGTIGQADAGGMSGGTYTLSGGFWVGSVTSSPRIVDAESCLFHDAPGGPIEVELCIDLVESNGVEPRQGGPAKLTFEMSEDLDGSTVIAENVQVNCTNQDIGPYTVSLDGTRTVVVEFGINVVDVDCCTLRFAGIKSTLGGFVTDAFDVVALQGDMDFSRSVSGGDAALIKPHFGERVGIDLEHPKWDYNRNGAVSGGDFALLKPLLGHIAPACP